MIAKYINVFKPSAVREGITQAADNTMSKGIEFYEAVIKRVMDEGTITGESDRWRTYKHPDKPDISVELNVGTGDTAVYFDTDQGSRAAAEISTDIEMPRAGKELMESEEVYRMGGDEYYKDIDEEITGGVGSLEDWIKMKRGYAAGGRVGMWRGGMPKGLAAALRTIRGKFGKGAIHQADEVVVDGDIYKAADPNRPPTEVEIETKYEELMDPEGGLPYYTIGELDNALVEARAYEKEMFRQYKSGELDKYVKPEVLEESRTAFQNKINNQVEKTYDDIAGGSGFTGDDYKYDAQILADGIAEDLGLVWDNLSNERQAQLYNTALARISKDMAMKRALRKASKPTKTLEGIEKTGTINISDPNVAEEFARFMRETDSAGAKKIDQTVELMNFDPKGRKKNAKGGRIGLKSGGPAGGASAGGNYGGRRNPGQTYGGSIFSGGGPSPNPNPKPDDPGPQVRIDPIRKNEPARYGEIFNMPTDVGLRALMANYGYLDATLALEDLIKGDINPTITGNVDFGPLNLKGTYSDDEQTLEAQFNKGPFNATVNYNAITGEPEYWAGYSKAFKDGGEVNLTVIEIPDISESGVESLFKRR